MSEAEGFGKHWDVTPEELTAEYVLEDGSVDLVALYAAQRELARGISLQHVTEDPAAQARLRELAREAGEELAAGLEAEEGTFAGRLAYSEQGDAELEEERFTAPVPPLEAPRRSRCPAGDGGHLVRAAIAAPVVYSCGHEWVLGQLVAGPPLRGCPEPDPE